jgi:CIC family chloride channel protein
MAIVQNRSLLARFLLWRVKNVKEKHFILILSFLVGMTSGLAGVVLKNTIHSVHHFLTKSMEFDSGNLIFLAFPVIGIAITVLFVKYIVKDDIGHGVTKILYAISKKNSNIKSHNNYTSMIGSTLTIGFGGSVGAEAPVVLTGASIGSNLARMFHMNYRTITLMLGCGAAGAIGGIFKAPIAGLAFTLEVLMLDLTMASLIPLLISSVTAATVAYFFMGEGVLFEYTIKDAFDLGNIPFYILLGIFVGFLSVYFTRTSVRVEEFISGFQKPIKKLLIGGVALGLMIYLFPPLYGEGYSTLQSLLNGEPEKMFYNSALFSMQYNHWLLLLFVAALFLLKVIASAFTNGSGGVGGIFAPTMFVGGVAGFFISRAINGLGLVDLPESNFALVGMAGMMAGVMHAPLMAMFLIAEITGGYALFIPLMITSTIAYVTVHGFESHSIYAQRLAKRGELITHNKDKAVLTLMKLGKVIETDLKKVGPDDTLGELVKVISHSRRNIFPVVEEDGQLLGIVLLDDIRHIMFNTEMHDNTYVRSLMIMPPTVVNYDDPMEVVMKKFEETSAWNLPVLQDGKYLGFVSKSKIFSTYRRVLIHFSEE